MNARGNNVSALTASKEHLMDLPDEKGHFGRYGGVFVAETLMQPLAELRQAYEKYLSDPEFMKELDEDLAHFVGRPSPLYLAGRWSKKLGGARIYLKREDMLHGGAHKTNQVLAQALLAKRMGKHRIIAETGAGQHGVATAMVGALLDLEVVIYMGEKDVIRQQPNVQRMELLGAKVITVTAGSSSLKDAINEALRDWIASYETTHYLLG
ncbi:MAG: pyridoxal-phosphate dependent enzyme, partial [Gammaproteobacteria bacterium]|nr:pyridoxal-phosphate dependent enzyme [Gammaproteobacteria bacterium]